MLLSLLLLFSLAQNCRTTFLVICWGLSCACTSENRRVLMQFVSLLTYSRIDVACLILSCVGYSNQDWYIPSPALRTPVAEGLTPEQTKETLNYFCKFTFLGRTHLASLSFLFYCTCLVVSGRVVSDKTGAASVHS